MCLIFLFFTFTQGLDRREGIVILSDFTNENAPIYVMTPYYENLTIDLYNSKDVLENTSFSNLSIYNNPNVSASIDQYIQFSEEKIDSSFCPIDEWGPPFQPARFYLSRQAIDLLTYNQTDDDIVQIKQKLHLDINTLDDQFNSINCYSIFQYLYNNQFAIDCDINQQSTFLIFLMVYDNQTQIIIDFTFTQMIQYQYQSPQQQSFIQTCKFRRTLFINTFDEHNYLLSQYLQYCIGNLDQQINDEFQVIYNFTEVNSTFYYLNANSNNLLNLPCKINPNTSLEQIFTNPMTGGFNSETWNLGFIFLNTSPICKCHFQQLNIQNYQFNCTNTIIELYQPNQIRKISNLNDEVVLVTGTNEAILAIYLERSYQSQNYFTISYQQIFEPQFYLIDITITNQYLAVILTNSSEIYQSLPYAKNPYLFCSIQQSIVSHNMIKVYYLQPQKKSVFYQSDNITAFSRFLSSLSQSNFGNFVILFDFTNSELKLITLFYKQLNIFYKNEQDFIDDVLQENIPPAIISLNIQGIFQSSNQQNQTIIQVYKSFQRLIIICFIKLEDSNFKLIGNYHRFKSQNEKYSLYECPVQGDIYIFQEIINSIDLLDGIFGPLLNFNYIPNYNQSRFYPYYQNHKTVMDKNKYIEKYAQQNVYKVLRSLNKDIYITQNIFGLVETLLTYNENDKITSVIYNQTCLINAKEYSKMEKQFPVQVEIQQCEQYKYLDLSNVLQSVDYFKEFQFYNFAVQYNNSLVLLCLKLEGYEIECSVISELQKSFDQIQQIYFTQGPIDNQKISFTITILYNLNKKQLLFYNLVTYIPLNIRKYINDYNITLFNQLDTSQDIISFKYSYISLQALFILFANAEIKVFTPGPINSTNIQKEYYFTSYLINQTINLTYCKDYKFIGFEITNYIQSKLAEQYLVVWCQFGEKQYFKPIISQYIIYEINKIKYWRFLPFYDAIISDKSEIILSGLILYVPIIRKTVYNQYFQYYNIYNLNDYTARSLVDKIDIEKRKNESIIIFPIQNFVNSIIYGSSISLTLIITTKKFQIYYLNQKAEFVFHLQKQFIQDYNKHPFVLMIAVYQPQKTLTMYRNYTLIYNFSSTQITFIDPTKPYELWINQKYLTQQGGFYQYLFLINVNLSSYSKQYFFNGPISSYTYSTNVTDLFIIPSPYLEINKFLGNYMQEVTLFGLITQIIDINDEIYTGLFSVNIENVNTYSDLILVLTDNYLLFYQKSSYPYANQQCSYTNYTQNFTNQNQSLCSIRLIFQKKLQKHDNTLLCQMQLNGVNSLIIVCQSKYFNKLNQKDVFQKENIQTFIYYEYVYYRTTNQIQIQLSPTNQRQFCYCYFNDLQPFVYNNQVYQVIKKSYQNLNTYFGIYLITSDESNIYFYQNSTYPDQKNDIPYQFSDDFALSVIKYRNNSQYLYLIILQPINILVQIISLEQHFPIAGQSRNLQFQNGYNFVRDERAVFIQTLNHNQPYMINDEFPIQFIAIGNNNQIYEIGFNVYTLQANLSHTFYQYLLCHYDILSRPQIELQYLNDTVFYIVSQCLSNQFEYQSLQLEMSYIFNQPNTNIIYTSLFVRNYSTNITRPVEILQPYLVNPQELHLQKVQLYQIFNVVQNTSVSHLLITNTTYFLIDLQIFTQNGYYLYYPMTMADQNKNESILINISAYNSYSNCVGQFKLKWYLEEDEINSKLWFFVLIGLIALVVVILMFIVLCGILSKQTQMEEYQFSYESDDKVYELELQKPEQPIVKVGDLFKDLIKGKNKNQYEELD